MRSYRQFQTRQVAEAARRDERLQFELDTMAGEGLEVVMADRPGDGERQVSAALSALQPHLLTSSGRCCVSFAKFPLRLSGLLIAVCLNSGMSTGSERP